MLKHLSRKYNLSVFRKPPEIPALKKYGNKKAIDELANHIKHNINPPEEFHKANYIPELGAADALDTGISLCFKDKKGKPRVIGGGDHNVPFTMQSISTLFGFIYALNKQSEGIVFQYVGKEPSGEPFNQLKWKLFEDEKTKRRVPFNPMINAGAIIISAMIPERYIYEDDNESPGRKNQKKRDIGKHGKLLDIDDFLEYVRKLCNNKKIDINWQVFESERKTGFNNRSLAWIMNDEGVFNDLLKRHKSTVDSTVIEDILGVYFRLCSIEVTCDDLAWFGAVLANSGKDLKSDEYLIPPRHATIATAMMSSSGLFDGSGEFAYNVGIPAKSGVSGGLVGVVPGKLGIAAYSPIVDKKGNSFRAQKIFEKISKKENLSIFSYKRKK